MRKDALETSRRCHPGTLLRSRCARSAWPPPRRTGRAGRHRREEAGRSPRSPGQAARQSLTPGRSGEAFPGDRAERRHSLAPLCARRRPPGPEAPLTRVLTVACRSLRAAGRGEGGPGEAGTEAGREPRRSGGPRVPGSGHPPRRGEALAERRPRAPAPGLRRPRNFSLAAPAARGRAVPLSGHARPRSPAPARPPSIFSPHRVRSHTPK